mmetsp:Transcript_67512/g.161141  ORF Transcript_67512/g.161141 Transcript_67512/m.161141 type:complete len:297 (+) Transcript_67512:110-1000(+)
MHARGLAPPEEALSGLHRGPPLRGAPAPDHPRLLGWRGDPRSRDLPSQKLHPSEDRCAEGVPPGGPPPLRPCPAPPAGDDALELRDRHGALRHPRAVSRGKDRADLSDSAARHGEGRRRTRHRGAGAHAHLPPPRMRPPLLAYPGRAAQIGAAPPPPLRRNLGGWRRRHRCRDRWNLLGEDPLEPSEAGWIRGSAGRQDRRGHGRRRGRNVPRLHRRALPRLAWRQSSRGSPLAGRAGAPGGVRCHVPPRGLHRPNRQPGASDLVLLASCRRRPRLIRIDTRCLQPMAPTSAGAGA